MKPSMPSYSCITSRFGSRFINRGLYLFNLFFTVALQPVMLHAQPGQDTPEYRKTITERARKIVNALSITDSVNYHNVVNVLVDQYSGLNSIQQNHKAVADLIKKDTAAGKEKISQLLKQEEEKKAQQVTALHEVFIGQLTQLLTPGQVDLVKDGMTYRVFPITYAAYQDMIPTLTSAQKEKIYNWLKEARELAMDGESSDKKHAIFGKFKGRINNYLSAEGYDLKKATEDWQQRIKEREKKTRDQS